MGAQMNDETMELMAEREALENKRQLDRIERALGNRNPVFAYTDGQPPMTKPSRLLVTGAEAISHYRGEHIDELQTEIEQKLKKAIELQLQAMELEERIIELRAAMALGELIRSANQ